VAAIMRPASAVRSVSFAVIASLLQRPTSYRAE
jgi:hypothetical protein